jgi:hypothetical protein
MRRNTGWLSRNRDSFSRFKPIAEEFRKVSEDSLLG